MVKLIEHTNNTIKQNRCITQFIEVNELPKYIIVYINKNNNIDIKDCIIQFSENPTKNNDIKMSLFENRICYKTINLNLPFIIITPKKDFFLLKDTKKYYLQYDIKFNKSINGEIIEINSFLF